MKIKSGSGQFNDQSNRFILATLFVLELILFCVMFGSASYRHRILNIGLMPGILTGLVCLSLLICVFMYFGIMRSERITAMHQKVLLLIVTESIYLFSDAAYFFTAEDPEFRIWNIADNTIYCICPILLLFLFWLFLDGWIGDRSRPKAGLDWVFKALVVFDLLFMLGNLFGHYYFSISADGIYHRGILYMAGFSLPTLMVLLCAVRILTSRISVSERLILMVYPLLPFVSALAQLQIPGPSLQSIAMFCSIMFLYTNLLVRREMDVMSQQRDLTESHLRNLQMQINPHFLYNTLASIASLCDSDAQRAQEMTYRLSDYLRDNFTDITKPAVISFGQEMDALEHYLSIESIRFPRIRVEHDIRSTEFMLPALTLQPLVENAIRHGICKRRGSTGTIRLATNETDHAWTIRITDDGVGFDTSVLSDDAKAGHIGIMNVRARLKILCGGDLMITSTPGRGTCCEITLPKDAKGVSE